MTAEGATDDPPVRVLLVEDSPTQAEATRALLAESGLVVEVARDGAAGLAAAERGAFDVVISDVVMPAMDGYELCRRLKALRGPDLPVVLLTSLTEPMDVIRGLESGADNFVTKPYEPATLRARVAALLESRRLRTRAHMRMGIDVVFLGRRFTITSDREQILDMLMSTFEDAVRANERLREHERQLADANALLEERARAVEQASRAKSEFLANMSHELRTPLNAVLGFSALLEEQVGAQLTQRQRRFLRNIRDAGDHLLDLINDVLDLSKVEAGKVELRPEVVSLASLLEPVLAATRTSAQDSGVAFEVDAADAPNLLLDPTRVRQVLFNLLSNAVKFTPAGGTVRLRVAVEAGDLAVEVADSGIGIPASAGDRVFGVFERLHEGRADLSGTGLGLAITKRLVDLHGGAIAYESAVGRGTTFRVHLPRVGAQPVAGARLLVVEDDRRDADLVVALASSHDMRVEVARTLRDARATIDRDPPLGVLIDVRLPDGRGEDLLRDLKADAATRDLPVIVVTVEAEPAAALALGADDYLTKPLDRQRLERWLAMVAGRRAAP